MTESTDNTQSQKKQSAFRPLRKVVYALGLLFMVWIVFGQAIPRTFFSQRENSSSTVSIDSDKKFEVIASHIQQIEQKLAALENLMVAMPAVQPPGAPGTPDDGRLAKLEEKITELENLVAEKDRSQGMVAAITVFSQMKEAALRGEEFSKQLSSLSKLASDNPDAQKIISELAPYAEKGISTPSRLQKEFERLVPKALANEGGSLMGNVKSLITVRKVGEQAGDDDESVLARSESRINAGDIAGAQKELAALSPAAAAIFSPWVDEAESMNNLRGKLEALQLTLSPPAPKPAE